MIFLFRLFLFMILLTASGCGFTEDTLTADEAEDTTLDETTDTTLSTDDDSNTNDEGTVTINESGRFAIINKYFIPDSTDNILLSTTNYSITSDGGFIVTGQTPNPTKQYNVDIYIAKFSKTGSEEWRKTFGGTDPDCGWHIKELKDGGYILASLSLSEDGDIKPYYIDFNKLVSVNNVILFKLDNAGNITQGNSFGSWQSDEIDEIIETSDKGYLLSIRTGASVMAPKIPDYKSITIAEKYRDKAQWLLKLNSSLQPEWQSFIGGEDKDGYGLTRVNSITEDTEGNYLLGGTMCFEDSKAKYHAVKLNSSGLIQWKLSLEDLYSSDDITSINSSLVLSDGSYIVSGNIFTSIRLTDNEYYDKQYDQLIVKISKSGSITWKTRHGGKKYDLLYGISESNNVLYTAGTVWNDNDFYPDSHGELDICISSFTSNTGEFITSSNYGGSEIDYTGDSAYPEIYPLGINFGKMIHVSEKEITIIGRTIKSKDYDLENLNSKEEKGFIFLKLSK